MPVKRFRSAAVTMAVLVVLCGLFAGAVSANGIVPYKLKMDRIDPDKPIRKTAIMSTVQKKFPGTIVSIREHRPGGRDCHIVKSMGKDGEFRIVHVACH